MTRWWELYNILLTNDYRKVIEEVAMRARPTVDAQTPRKRNFGRRRWWMLVTVDGNKDDDEKEEEEEEDDTEHEDEDAEEDEDEDAEDKSISKNFGSDSKYEGRWKIGAFGSLILVRRDDDEGSGGGQRESESADPCPNLVSAGSDPLPNLGTGVGIEG